MAEQQWSPRFTYKQTRELIGRYDKNPKGFGGNSLNSLRQHAQHYNIPFYEGDFTIGEAIKQFGGGFMEGFTTANIVDPPDNQFESIARTLGHLVGFAPGILSGPLGAAHRALNMGRKVQKFQSIADASKMLRGVRGIPLYVAEEFVTPRARKLVGGVLKSGMASKYGAASTAKNFLLKEQTKSIMEGAFNLGTASAISSWQHGVDAMMDSFKHGAAAGGAFRYIGNTIGYNTKAMKDAKGNILEGKKYKIPMSSIKAEKWVRRLAGSLLMGLPATARGMTTPEQIYEYLMGAYFGGNEKPWTVHKAGKIFTGKVLPAAKTSARIRMTKDAELVEGLEWNTLEPEVKYELKRMSAEATGGISAEQHSAIAYDLAEKMGLKHKIKKGENFDEKVFENYEDALSLFNKKRMEAESKKKLKEVEDDMLDDKKLKLTTKEKKEILEKKYQDELPGEIDKEIVDMIKELEDAGVSGTANMLMHTYNQLIQNAGRFDPIAQRIIDRHTPQQLDLIMKHGKRLDEIRSKDLRELSPEQAAQLKDKQLLADYEKNILEDTPKLYEFLMRRGKKEDAAHVIETRKQKDLQRINESYKAGGISEKEFNKSYKKREEFYDNIVKKFKDTPLIKKLDPEKADKITEERDITHIITGGEEGVASLFTKEGEKRGIGTIQSTHPEQKVTYGKGKFTENIKLNSEDLSEANIALQKAVTDLGIDISTYNKYALDAMKRDYINAKESQAVIVFDSLNPNLKNTEGWSKFATKMAIDLGKPTYVFDMSPKDPKVGMGAWFKYNPKKNIFETMPGPPKLPNRYAIFSGKLDKGIKVSEKIKDAITGLFAKYDKEGFKAEYEAEKKLKENRDELESEMPETGERIVTRIDNSMDYLIHRFLGKELKEITTTNAELNELVRDYSEKSAKIANDILTDFSWKKEDEGYLGLKNRSEEWADLIELNVLNTKDTGIKVSEAMRGEMRKWVTVQQQGQPVRLIRFDGTNLEIADKNFPFTFGGKKKAIIEPIKDIEIIYQELTGEIPKDGVYSMLDTITFNGRDVELSRLTQEALAQGYDFETAYNLKKEYISKAIKLMKEKDYHPFSGNGDKDRIMFVKYHPNYKEVKVGLDGTASRKAYNLDKQLLDVSYRDWVDIMKSNIAYELSLNGKTNVQDVMKDGYIGNATGFNKRTQVWMTGGWRGDGSFLQRYGGKDINLTKEGNWKSSLIDDPVEVANILKANNIEIPEGFDGAILATEKALDMMNKDAGHPYSGQNKSFLVLRDPNKGTMLGKFMVHKVHPDMSKMMNAHGDGVNFLIMKSAIKQRGDRGGNPGSYDLNGGKLNLHGDAKNIIEIPPESFRYSHSVFQDNNMLGMNDAGTRSIGMKIVKQMMTQPHPEAFSKISQKVIDDWYNEYAQKSFDGKREYNTLIDRYLNEINPEKRKEYYDEILDNFDNIGVKRIFDLLNTPGEGMLSQELLLKILKTNKDAIEALSNSAELNGHALESETRGLVEFTGTADRIIKNLGALKEEAYPMFFDKYTARYIEKALDGWVAQRVLNPKVKNGIMARMRPYDVHLQNIFPELNTDAEAQKKWGKNADELFMLGDLYRDTIMHTNLPKIGGRRYRKTTLGELWDLYNKKGLSKNNKDIIEDVFEAISVRVPQDSMSGAQVLHFRGFTGIKDHGILQHGRVLRAEGGADLDGDESFVYFGGKTENGTGEGMKKSFKDMFKAQKEEFYIGAESKLSLPTEIGIPTTHKSGVTHYKQVYKGLSSRFSRLKALIRKTGRSIWNKTTAWYGPIGYKYSGVSHPSQKMPSEFYEVARSLEKQLGVEEGYFNSALVNIFPKGQKLGRHQDFEDIFHRTDKTVGKVATITLGANTDISIKKGYGKKTPEEVVTTKDGDLYVMPGQKFQEQYTHAVRIAPGERISLTFRHIPKNKLPKRWSIHQEKPKKETAKDVKLPNVKKMFEKELLKSENDLKKEGVPPEVINVMKGDDKSHPYAKFYPGVRLYTGGVAAGGRNTLAPIVSLTQNMRAAWSSIAQLPGRQETISNIYQGDFHGRIVRIAKESSQRQRLLANAMTAFGADPMDMTGLKDFAQLQKILEDSYFEQKYQIYSKKNNKWWTVSEKAYNQQMKKRTKNPIKNNFESTYEKISNFNRAFFGRNWGENRSFTNNEKYEMIKEIDSFQTGSINTAIPKFAHTLKDLNIDINIFDKINVDAVKNTYETMNEKATKVEYLKELLGRSFLGTPESPTIYLVSENGLYNEKVRLNMSKDIKGTKELLKEYGFVNDKGVIKGFVDSEGKPLELNPANLKAYLDMKAKEADRFLYDDLHDMNTLDLIDPLIRKNRDVLTDDIIKDISTQAERYKSISILQQFERNAKGLGYGEVSQKEENRIKRIRDMQIMLTGETIYKTVDKERSTKLLDMGRLDTLIEHYKNQLPEAGKKLFDYLTLGSLRNKNFTERIEKAFKAEKAAKKGEYKGKYDKKLKDMIYDMGAKTSTTKLGYDSNAISPKSIQEFLSNKNKFFKKTMEDFVPENEPIIKEVKKELNKIAPETTILGRRKEDYDLTAYEGLKPGKMTNEQRATVAELEHNLKQIPEYSKYDLNELLAGIYGEIDPLVTKKLNQMNHEDFRRINRWFKATREGLIFDRLSAQVDEINSAKVTGWDMMIMPEQANKRMMKDDIKWLHAKKLFQNNLGELEYKRVLMPTQYGDTIRNNIGRLHEVEDGFSVGLVNEFNNKIGFLEQIKDGDAINAIAMRRIELTPENKAASKIYEQQWESDKKTYNWDILRNKKYILDIGEGRKTYTGRQIQDRVIKVYEEFMENKHKLITGETGALDEYIIDYYDKNRQNPRNPKLDWKLFLDRMHKALETNDSAHILESLKIGIDGMRHMGRSMTIDLLPPTEYVGKYGKNKGKKISVKDYYQLTWKEKQNYREDRSIRAREYEKLDIASTGYIKGYFPHYFLSQTDFKKSLERELSDLQQMKKTLSKEEYLQKYSEVLIKYQNKNGDMDLSDFMMIDKIDADLFGEALSIAGKKKEVKEEKHALQLNPTNLNFNNMNIREFHAGGYTVGPENIHLYLRNLSRTAFRQLAGMTTNYNLHSMVKHMKKRWLGKKLSDKDYQSTIELIDGWKTFWSLYGKRAMGMPTIISDKMYNTPHLKLNVTPFGWWADNRVANWVNGTMKKLGLAKKLPDELTENLSKKDKERVEKLIGKNAFDMQRWSNLEAKYELATLMTHPRTPINNIFGGSLHTFQSVGYEPLKKARSLEEVMKINPKLNSWEKVYDFVEGHGVLPELVIHQFGLERGATGARAKAFITDIANKVKGIEDIKRVDLVALGEKHGVTKSIVNLAGKFMSGPERMLRRDAFMAHYIKAWERFGGALKDHNHPILIEFAKKGVKATQFLYNAAERPAFATTGLGKIMTRFQLWAWNAVKFRNDVRKQGKLYGFKANTEAMKKFERMMMADMFVLALGSVFMYSIFGQTIPAPYNWLQDTAEWVFGDEKDRDRAFFGTYPGKFAPLQMITPPIARIPISFIREFAEDDYTKLADYYSWSMVPFGRMIRDVAQPEKGLIANPGMLVEKTIGFPLRGVSRLRKKIKEGESPRVPTPGKGLF